MSSFDETGRPHRRPHHLTPATKAPHMGPNNGPELGANPGPAGLPRSAAAQILVTSAPAPALPATSPSVPTASGPASLLPRVPRRPDEALSRLILAADQPDFDRQLTAILQELISFDLAMISLYHDNALIEVASTSQPEQLASEVLASYAKHTYRHSPFFQMHRHKIQSGFYLMENMARHPALARPSGGAEMLELDQGEEVGYVTAGWPKRLKELDIALRVSDRDTVQVALYRTGNRGFSAADLAAVAPIQSSLFAICGRYWQKRARALETPQTPLQRALGRIGGADLSPRESDVVMQLIAGESEKDIAESLHIGLETIKTHRKRAYHKLGVTTRVELLVKLLDVATAVEGTADGGAVAGHLRLMM